ncbi:MAG: ATP-binding cassette domain-containing protein [Candidatus Delongbacteria bacterium]|nr:ATP-binding cassette domain-containing protein [Candidatus Delongbacteria bacterium]MBN2833861.1 ATP-binding cassette domain-containing protein [Candidatus Delongbacteria bacterium]
MVKINNLKYIVGDFTIIESVSLDIEEKSIYVFHGPSGCGKTTLLKLIAGLLDASDGEITRQSDAGYMFQENTVFKWLSVKDNITFVNDSFSEEDYKELLKTLEIEELVDRSICDLSGGQKQRISLARTLLYNKNLLLLDEPFSSLDKQLKTRLIPKLNEYIKKKGKTLIFITHDTMEAELIDCEIVQFERFPLKYGV